MSEIKQPLAAKAKTYSKNQIPVGILLDFGLVVGLVALVVLVHKVLEVLVDVVVVMVDEFLHRVHGVHVVASRT